MAKVKADDVYDGSKIKELPYPLNVQKRGEMYIGTRDETGFATCIREIVNNSVDEMLAGYCDTIAVLQHDDFTFSVADNGRGVPFDKQSDGTNTLQKIFGNLHSGRNFEAKTVYSTGLNGVGSSVVNALCSSFTVEARRGSDMGQVWFENGYFIDVKVKKSQQPLDNKNFKKSSTKVTFTFNPEFFEKGSVPNPELIINFLKETAQLNVGLTVSFCDIRKGGSAAMTFKFDDGIRHLLKENLGKKGIIDPIYFPPEVVNDTKIEIAFNYTSAFNADNIESFCNTIRTSEGGTHVTGFKRAISQKLLAYVRDNGLTKEKIENEDIYVGLEAVVSVFVFNPKYTSQTKQKLSNNDVGGHTITFVNRNLDAWLASNPAAIKILAQKFAMSAKSRLAQKRALESVKKESSSLFTSLSDISKFSDCVEDRSGRTELFIVEG